ncbi:MAG TPA: dual specificity protein phosphatase family protein [Vicinamibacterales bacterium]
MRRARQFSRLVSAIVLATAMSAGPVLAGPAATIAPAVHIDNFGQINARYYRGGQPEGRDYTDLAALGVKTIVNLTSDDAQAEEPALARQNGLRYFQIPMTTRQAPTAAQLAEFMAIVDDPANQPVYVHCVGGRHRTGVMTAVYRMTDDGWTSDQAFAEMKKYQFGMDFLHPEFKKFVYEFRPAAQPTTPAVLATQVIN